MRAKLIAVFFISVAISTLAATYRFLDSAHVMGTIRKGGGTARHPALLEKGKDAYTLIATAAVIPPYRGDIRVAVEGEPRFSWEIYETRPAVALNIHHRPDYRDNTFYNLRPKDRLAVWVRMRPVGTVKAVTAKATAANTSERHRNGGSEDGDAHMDSETDDCESMAHRGYRRTNGLSLTFRDASTGEKLLGIPIIFKGKGGIGYDR
jgi:hypothetical protein